MKKLISTKSYHKLYIQTARQKVAALLWRYPEKEFSLSDIAQAAGVKKANLGQIIGELVDIGFAQVEKLTKIWRIKANPKNWFFIRTKIVYNLNSIYETGLVDRLYEIYNHPRSIILFGKLLSRCCRRQDIAAEAQF